MTKQEFLRDLRRALAGLPKREIKERLAFYGEMIDDRIEEGLSEEAATAEIGGAEAIAAQILDEAMRPKRQKREPSPQKEGKAKTALLIAAASPVWLPLLAAFFAVVISLSASLWAVIASLWAVEAALALVAVLGVFLGACLAIPVGIAPGAALVGAASVSAGVTVFLFFGALKATRAAVFVTVRSFRQIFRKKSDRLEGLI